MTRSSGFSLLETLISVAIVAGCLSAILPLLGHLHKSNQALSRKLDQLDAKSSVMAAVMNPDICRCHLNPNSNAAADDDTGLFFAAADIATAEATFSTVRSGCDTSSDTLVAKDVATESGLVPVSIGVRNMTPTGDPKEYTGNIHIEYQSTNSHPVQPSDIAVRFLVDDSDPARTFIKCCSPGALGSNCVVSPPAVPAPDPTDPSGGGGGGSVTTYYQLSGNSYQSLNDAFGCTGSQVYAALWRRGEYVTSSTDLGDCTPPIIPGGDYTCVVPVSPEVKEWEGCY